MNEPWPQDRRAELAKLQDLLIAARTLNNGSGVIQRLEQVIQIADDLTHSDGVAPRRSFMEFLLQEATRSAP